MPDLKKLLEPLDDEQMPDRWASISRREVTPLPEPRRPRLPVFAVAAAVVALLVAAVSGLLPLANVAEQRQPGASDEPPAWLAEAAYKAAYLNGDMIPDSAQWALLPRNAIPTPVGTGGAGSTEQEYVIVLTGHFTAYMASAPSFAPPPTGTVLSVAFDAATHAGTDSALTDGDTGIEGLMPFTLPTPDQVYASPEGWSFPVPPGWNVSAGPRSTAVATSNVPAPTQGGPYSSLSDFPNDGIEVTVSRDFPPTDVAPAYPPLSFSKDFHVVWGPDGRNAAVWARLVGGTPGVFQITVALGPDASPIDRSALREMIAAFAFPGTQASASSSDASSAGLPSADSVVDGRFVESVQLDDGRLRVDPPPTGTSAPVLRLEDADMLWADPAFAGKAGITVGYGLITLTRGEHGIEPIDAVPGWIAFASGGHTYCPNMTTAPSPADLPSSGFAAVSLISRAGNFTYRAASDICGTVTQPVVEMATHVESIPWEQVGQVSGGRVDIRYTRQNCGRDDTYVVSADGDRYTLAVDVTVTNDPLPCPAPLSVDTSVLLTGDGGGTVGALDHAALGPVRQVTGATP